MSDSDANRTGMMSFHFDGPAEDREACADNTIMAFNSWFQEKLQDGPLAPSERALLKTFLYWAISS